MRCEAGGGAGREAVSCGIGMNGQHLAVCGRTFGRLRRKIRKNKTQLAATAGSSKRSHSQIRGGGFILQHKVLIKFGVQKESYCKR